MVVANTQAYFGNAKGGSITAPLTSCLTSLDYSVLQIKTKIVSCHTADSKPVKQEVNSIVILPHLVFPDYSRTNFLKSPFPFYIFGQCFNKNKCIVRPFRIVSVNNLTYSVALIIQILKS
jgi:hypothetical protein